MLYDAGEEVPLQVNAILALDFKKFIEKKPDPDPLKKLPLEYYDLADAFSKEELRTLLRHRGPSYNIEIKLKEGAEPPYKRAYPMSSIKNDAVKK